MVRRQRGVNRVGQYAIPGVGQKHQYEDKKDEGANLGERPYLASIISNVILHKRVRRRSRAHDASGHVADQLWLRSFGRGIVKVAGRRNKRSPLFDCLRSAVVSQRHPESKRQSKARRAV